jgi:hypothetical protein
MRRLFPVALLWAISCGSPSTPAKMEPEPLTPGQFQAPFVHLQKLIGRQAHLHVAEVRYRPSDKRLFQCSYTFGVVNAADPANMRYEFDDIEHVIPNDNRSPGCIHLAPDKNIVYTTHHGNISNPAFISGWDISKKDPADSARPVQLPVLQEPGVSYEGIDVGPTGHVYVALHQDGLGVYQRDPMTNALSRVGTATGFTNALGVRVRDDKTAVVTDGFGGLVTVDITDPANPKKIGQVAIAGGQSHDVALNGNTAYVAAGQLGMVIVDITNLTSPKVLSQMKTPGTAIRLSYSAGVVTVAAWNDIRAYNVLDPAKPVFIGSTRLTVEAASAIPDDPDVGRLEVTSRNLAVAHYGDIIFAGNWYYIHSYRLRADRKAPSLFVPEDATLVEFGPVAEGTTSTRPVVISNNGTAPLTLFNNWATAPFTVEPKQVRIEPGEDATLTVSYTAGTVAKEQGFLSIYSDDPAQPLRTSQLIGNRPGVSIGKPFPLTNVHLTDGEEWSSSQVKGKIMVLAYFATF